MEVKTVKLTYNVETIWWDTLDNNNMFGWKASLEEYILLLKCEVSRAVQPSPILF